MKYADVASVISNQALCSRLVGGQTKCRRDVIRSSIQRFSPEQRELFLSSIEQAAGSRSAYVLFKCFQQVEKESNQRVAQISTLFARKKQRKKKEKQSGATALVLSQCEYRLCDLEEEAKRLQGKRGRELLDSIKALSKGQRLPSLDAQRLEFVSKASHSHPPFDSVRTGRHRRDVFLNASDVCVQGQSFVLSGCPVDRQQAAWYLESLIEQRVRVLVSLHNEGEAKGRCNEFWKQSELEQLPWTSEYTVRQAAVKTLWQEGAVRIDESLLIASNGEEQREMVHLHYVGWKDRGPIPNEELFAKLLLRMKEISPEPDRQVAINCKAGVGRTGTTAVAYTAMQQKERVNIPQLIVDFRRQRSGIVGQASQFSQIYAVVARLSERVLGQV